MLRKRRLAAMHVMTTKPSIQDRNSMPCGNALRMHFRSLAGCRVHLIGSTYQGLWSMLHAANKQNETAIKGNGPLGGPANPS
jgi:hypothetical protein